MTKNERKRAHADAQRRYREKLAAQGLKEVTIKVPINEKPDPNQTNLVEDNRILEIRKAIDLFREKNKGTVILAKQKDLASLVQQIEEISK